MGPYSSGDKSIKISHDFQEKDKEVNSQELPLLPLQDLYLPSWFHKLTFTFWPSHTSLLFENCQNRMFYIYTYFTFYIYCKNS